MNKIHTEHLTDKLRFNMILVEGGKFMMGAEEGGDDDERPVHQVDLDSFCIGEFPVTQDIWCEVMKENPSPSYFEGDRRPVEQISWYDAIEFCNALSKRQGLKEVYTIDKKTKDPNNNNENDELKWLVTLNDTANGYRLPTEAEWEFAARGGKHSKGYLYAGSNKLKEVGWYGENSDRETKHVGQLQPNELGLFDMSGNVYEWCWDWFDNEYYKECASKTLEKNPRGPSVGVSRVLRGGLWDFDPQDCRSSYRYFLWPLNRDFDLGFRLVLSPSQLAVDPAFL